jgi:hypothetical protein
MMGGNRRSLMSVDPRVGNARRIEIVQHGPAAGGRLPSTGHRTGTGNYRHECRRVPQSRLLISGPGPEMWNASSSDL